MDAEHFTLIGDYGGQVFIWCPRDFHCEAVDDLEEALRWAEKHTCEAEMAAGGKP